MAGLTLIQESFRVETYVRVIAVRVIQPYGMVYDLPWLLTAHLTQTTINRYPMIYKGLPRTAPCSTLVELLLIHRRTTSSHVIPPPTPPAYVIPAYNKETHSQDSVLCGLYTMFCALTPSRQALCNAPLVSALFPSWRNRPDSNRQTEKRPTV